MRPQLASYTESYAPILELIGHARWYPDQGILLRHLRSEVHCKPAIPYVRVGTIPSRSNPDITISHGY
jgi:hypothetical protein